MHDPRWPPLGSEYGGRQSHHWLQNRELYNVAKDPTEAHNIAEANSDTLQHLQLLFYAEASKYHVLPIDNSKTGRMGPAYAQVLSKVEHLSPTMTVTHGSLKALPPRLKTVRSV